LAPDPEAQGPSSDDLLALADAVREAARPVSPPEIAAAPDAVSNSGVGRETARRGHLRVLTTE
jgi:hypothetical protein